MDRTPGAEDAHVSGDEFQAARKAVRGTPEWDEVFKGIAALNMTADGTGPTASGSRRGSKAAGKLAAERPQDAPRRGGRAGPSGHRA